MGVIGNSVRVTQLGLEKYLNTKTLFEERLYHEEHTEDTSHIEVAKEWESIYYLLTGYTSSTFQNAHGPLLLILFKEKYLANGEYTEYGPITYCAPEEVSQISKAVPNFNLKNIRSKFESLR